MIWWGVALLAPVALTLIAVGIHVLAGGEAPPFTLWKQEWYLAPVLMLILLLPVGGPGGEEPFGWRGYVQPKLHKKWGRWGPLIASFIIGIVWSIWHLPEFFNPASSQYALGIGFFVPLMIAWIANSIIMTWLYNRTGGSVLIAGVMYHLMVDISATLLVDFTLTGMMNGEVIPKADLRLIGIETAVVALAALFLVVATKGQLGYSEKEDK
jgi:membrane protease YdiL (CAAX protease family)